MEGHGRRPSSFHPPSQQPPYPHLQPQQLDPNLLLLQNLGTYLQNNPSLLSPFNNPNLSNNPFFPQNPNFVPTTPLYPNPNQYHTPFPNFSQPQNPNPNPNNSAPKEQRQSSTPNRIVNNPKFPVNRKPTISNERLELLAKIEAAVVSARREFIEAGENVSALKVSESVLLKLQVDSWESLGYQLQEIPSLHSLIITEGKINAFINCYVAVHKITSLFDLQMAICKNEGVKTFEELELGPFVRQPLVVHYFSVNKDVKGVYKITGEEIVSYLSEFFDARKHKSVKIEEFLEFIAKKCQVTSWERLGVRIQSLGMHIAFLREAHTSNDLVLKKCMETVKEKPTRPSNKRSLFTLQKQQLDDRFSAITERVASFASVNKEFCGRHIRFVSSSSDEDIDATDSSDSEGKGDVNVESNQCQLSSLKRKSGDRVSSCPYPSVAEEMTRLGLRSEKQECSSSSNKNLKGQKTSEPAKKRRKLKSLSHGRAIKQNSFFRRGGTETQEENNRNSVDLSCANDSIRMFITTWKEACREHTASEVFEKILQFHKMSVRQQKRLQSLFSAYPLLGLLNVAVTSIKNGMWDSMYDTFQLIGELGQANAEGNKHYESIDVEPVEKAPAVSKEAQKSSPCVKVDDVMRKVSEYLAENAVLAGGNSLLDVVLMFSRQLCHCEVWLAQQFSVKEFKLLGHGDFFSFLRSHASLIPKELLEFVGDRAQEPQSLEASILQQQLAVLVSQASSNLWEDNAVTKEKISELLMRQFPFISFKVVGMKGVEELLDTVRQHRNSITSSCVVFSSTLLGTSDNTELVPDAGQMVNNLGSVTTKDAVEILHKAPFLLDLNTWSHWDHVYAPTLGPLLKWLLTEANAEGLLCVLTRDGKIIRIDPLASVDMFFQALLQESPLGIAVQLLSLFVLSGGRRHVPMSLLKCQARQAFEVIMANSMQKYDTNGDQSGDKTLKELKFDEAAGRSSSFVLSKNLRGIDGAVAFVSRIVIDCLGFLPSEFRCFASEILFSGLQSVVKDVASAVLCQCKGIEERLMLHDIGFSLGIVEWTHDHNSCCPITDNYSVIAIQPSPLICMGSYAKGLESTEYPALKNSSVAPHQDEHCKTHDEISNHLGSPLVDSGEVISHRSTDKDIDEQKEAARLIESIRREEFGLDPSISDVESSMLKKQHARLGRALNCLSQELYSQDSHFLLELVQNADDNVYPDNVEPTLTFILQHSGIVVLNNEKGFTSRNIRALCDVGNSTKKGSSVGYIGQKGIGFKSVFRVTDAPEIHSNGFHIKFDISEGQIGFVLPSIVSPCNIEMYKKLAYESDHPKGGSCWNTCILLPFKSKLLEGLAINCILSMFSDLHPSLLLFLHRLQCIKLRNMLNDSLIVMRKEVLGDGIIRVSHGKKKMTWFVASNKLLPKVFRSNVQTTEISIALTLNETEHGDYEAFLDQQPVFAFLPLRTYGLKFILQADFILPSSREEVDGDSPWNQWLLSEFPGLFVDAEKSFCALPCFQQNPAKAVTAYMSFVPLMGEVHGFFSGLPRMIISKLRQSNCLLQDGYKDKWVPPCKVLRGWNEQAQRLLSDSLLYEHLGLGFLDKDISLSDALARALGVEEYGPRILVRVISSLGCLKDGIKSMGLGWLLSWINELYNMFHSYAPNLRNSGLEQDLLNSLKKVPFIPLSDGSYGSLEEGAIWFHSNYISAGVDQIGNETFPHLHATLRVVSHALFSEAASDVALVNNCTRMLLRIGVQQMSAHDLIRNHILPSISDGKLEDKDQQLMTDYAAFIMFHLQSNCGDCHVESEQMFSELRSKAIILTNYGYQRPFEVSIHFSGEYGNSVDSNKFIHALDYKWHEVDPMYLEHPVTKSCGLVKWREFLQKLGVTDFVKVVMVEKSVADLSSNVLNQMMCHGDLVSSGLVVKDWESSELFHILSLLAKDGSQDKCRYFLEVLDTLWDDHFSDKVSGSCSSISGAKNIFFKSSLMQCISEIRWISSSFDSELHYPTELFYDCDAVRSILGSQAAYAVPKIRSTKLLSEIGFKTQVTLDDALLILRSWQRSESPFTASLLQMSRLYTFIWKEMTRSRQQVVDALDSRPFIFVPYGSVKIHEDIVAGLFLSPGEVYWNDSTGALDCSTDVKFSVKTTNSLMSKTLCTVYPGLHDFFVTECGVNEDPPLRQYLQILQQLSRNALPFEAANTVFKVFLKWSDGLKNGALSSDDMSYLKNCLSMSEFTVLPTLQDKWVSLHSSFGLVCWCDDDMLKKEFKYSDNIEFLYFGVLTDHEKEMLYRKVSVILQNIGIPALSKIVSREAIYYGPVDCGFKTSMVGWVLPFAQRYIYNLHPEKYGQFKQSGFSELHLLRIIVVEKLFYRNVITRCDCASKKRSECSSLLQGNILYTTRESDSHSIFMELSRLFFDGTSELHLANFLHMIATMAESGSTEEQIEFFILHSQKMAKLPEDESVWFLSSPAALPENDEMVLANALITNMNEHTSVKSKKKPGCSSWPPADWKTAPGFNHSRENMFRTQAAITDLTTILGESDDHFEEEKADATLTEISEDVIEDVLLPPVEIQPDGLCNQPQSSLDALADPTNVVVESISPEEGQSKSSGRDHTPGAQQAMLTGRLGELVAFRYFAGKFGGEVVNWVNQDKETGLPYDIVVGEEEESIKYFEVKASRYAKKDWFVISTREWQFAAEKGDSFSIAHVILNGQNLTRITIYKNPVKLCQLGKLQLAVMTPRLYQEPIHPSSQDHL